MDVAHAVEHEHLSIEARVRHVIQARGQHEYVLAIERRDELRGGTAGDLVRELVTLVLEVLDLAALVGDIGEGVEQLSQGDGDRVRVLRVPLEEREEDAVLGDQRESR